MPDFSQRLNTVVGNKVDSCINQNIWHSSFDVLPDKMRLMCRQVAETENPALNHLSNP
jgi:ribosomal protein L31E